MIEKPQNPKFNNCYCLYNFSLVFLHMTGFFYDYHWHSTDISDFWNIIAQPEIVQIKSTSVEINSDF